jgi:hypothetical protein
MVPSSSMIQCGIDYSKAVLVLGNVTMRTRSDLMFSFSSRIGLLVLKNENTNLRKYRSLLTNL